MKIRLGTRKSPLALTQSRLVARLLKQAVPGLEVELVEMVTSGDRDRTHALQSFGGTGVFVKELETALRDKRVDIAVHSLKDLPVRQPKGLCLGAILSREDTRDAAVVRGGKKLAQLPPGSVIGSGSPRRRAQLKALHPHLEFAEIRGNVETRLRKVAEGGYQGTILARAGLKRLGLLKKATQTLPLGQVLPAPGQGALAIECRSKDARVVRVLRKLHDKNAAACVTAERSLLEALGGGCHLPLGALGTLETVKQKPVLRLRAALGLPDGSSLVKAEAEMPAARARQLGQKAARLILAGGGREILRALAGKSGA